MVWKQMVKVCREQQTDWYMLLWFTDKTNSIWWELLNKAGVSIKAIRNANILRCPSGSVYINQYMLASGHYQTKVAINNISGR